MNRRCTGASDRASATWDSPTMGVHVYDGLNCLCNHSMSFGIPFYRQRTGRRIRQRLLRGQVLQQQHGALHVA